MALSAKTKDILIDIVVVLGVIFFLFNIVPAKWRKFVVGSTTTAA